jgi:hypothetical protein
MAPAVGGLFGEPSRKAARKVWVKALLEAAETSVDDDITRLCLEQLRWCGCACPCVVRRLYAVACSADSPAVGDFAVLVARELEGKRVGL